MGAVTQERIGTPKKESGKEKEKSLKRFIRDLSHDDWLVRKHAAWMLARFAQSGDAKIIVDAGAIKPLVKCISDSNVIVCYRAVWAIGLLAKKGEAQAIIRAGAMPLLEKLIGNGASVSIMSPYSTALEWTTVGRLAMDALESIRKKDVVV